MEFRLPTGLVPDPIDERDYDFLEIMAVGEPVDWEKGFRLPTPPDADQDSSDSCVGHTFSYYHWQLKSKKFSVRDLFSRIAMGYGATLRDGAKAICDDGQLDSTEAPDPSPQTPQNMRKRDDIDPKLGHDDIERDYWRIPKTNIDAFAMAIRDYQGVAMALNGDNDGWANLLVPEPPTGSGNWGHAIYGMGFHMHTNPDGSREKCIIAKSSWCKYVKEHHIRERYFKREMVQGGWVLIPKGEGMKSKWKIGKISGTETLVVYCEMTAPEALDSLVTLPMRTDVDPDAPLKERIAWDQVKIDAVLVPQQ